MMAATLEPNSPAMVPQLSPDLTVYSTGGSGVSVGVSVGMSVSVGVRVRVGVVLGVGLVVGDCISPPPLSEKYKAPAPITRKTANNPSATGRLRVNTGIRAPCTAFSDFVFCLGVALNSLPHTTQRVAFSASRVPQTGHSLVGVISGLIIPGLYHVAEF